MDELLEKFISGSLSKEGQRQLFSSSFQRQNVLDGLFKIVVKSGGNVSHDAARVFIAVYNEFGNDKTSELMQSTIATLISKKPSLHNTFSSLDNSVYEFCLGAQAADGKSRMKLDKELYDKAMNVLNTSMAGNIHYSGEFAEKRKQAADELLNFMNDFPAETLTKIAPAIEVKSGVLTDYLQQNWDKLSDKQLLKISEVVSEKYLELLGHERDLTVTDFTKAMLKSDEFKNSSGVVKPNRLSDINENIIKIRNPLILPDEQTLPEVNTEQFRADYTRFKVSELITTALHETDHLIQRSLSSYDNNVQDLSIINYPMKDYYDIPQERDAYMIKNYFSVKLKEQMKPQSDFINLKWDARNAQGVFLRVGNDKKMEQLAADNDFIKIATDIFGLKNLSDENLYKNNIFIETSLKNKNTKTSALQ